MIICSPIWGITTSGTPQLRLSLTLFMPACDTKAAARWSTSSCGALACTVKFAGAGPNSVGAERITW